MLTAKENSGSQIEPIESGVHVAICYGVLDLGTHTNPTFGTEQRKVLIQWEVPGVRGDFEKDGKKVNAPRVISKRYTVSLSEKANLLRDLESWRGRKFTSAELSGFDLKKLLGAPCQLNIVHETSRDGKVYATVQTIMALPKGVTPPKPETPQLFFSFEENADLPAGVPDWIKKIQMESKEWQERLAPKTIPNPAESE